MTYDRMVRRSFLIGDYDSKDDLNLSSVSRRAVAGDLRRLETDQRDEWHLAEYAKRAGVTPTQAKAVLDAFFEGAF